MLRNNLKTALCNLHKHFGYTAINLVGLALLLTVTLQIFLFVQSELAYDKFHERSEDLYRIVLDGSFAGTDLNAQVTPGPMAGALVSDFPEVESATRIFPFANEHMVRYAASNTAFLDDAVYFVDSLRYE